MSIFGSNILSKFCVKWYVYIAVALLPQDTEAWLSHNDDGKNLEADKYTVPLNMFLTVRQFLGDDQWRRKMFFFIL